MSHFIVPAALEPYGGLNTATSGMAGGCSSFSSTCQPPPERPIDGDQAGGNVAPGVGKLVLKGHELGLGREDPVEINDPRTVLGLNQHHGIVGFLAAVSRLRA